jgi:hypothetical protein
MLSRTGSPDAYAKPSPINVNDAAGEKLEEAIAATQSKGAPGAQQSLV